MDFFSSLFGPSLAQPDESTRAASTSGDATSISKFEAPFFVADNGASVSGSTGGGGASPTAGAARPESVTVFATKAAVAALLVFAAIRLAK